MRFEDETLPFGAIGSYFQRRLLVISAREKRVFSSDKDLQHLTVISVDSWSVSMPSSNVSPSGFCKPTKSQYGFISGGFPFGGVVG